MARKSKKKWKKNVKKNEEKFHETGKKMGQNFNKKNWQKIKGKGAIFWTPL